jgi:hypothetical protein
MNKRHYAFPKKMIKFIYYVATLAKLVDVIYLDIFFYISLIKL